MEKKILLNEIKTIELDILLKIDSFCRLNNITYFLCGGTLLGAIRHKGFIPWDDDIDIMMSRENFNYLKKYFHDKELLLLAPGDDDYYYNFAKVVDKRTTVIENGYRKINDMGIWVDIFIIDNVGDDYQDAIRNFKKLDKIRRKINSCAVLPVFRKNIFAFFKSLYYLIFYKNKKMISYQNKYIELVSSYGTNSKYKYISGGAYKKKEIFQKELFESNIEVEFEKHSFLAPLNYDDYLQQLYGNYMQLPPANEQTPHHNIDAFWK